MAKYVVLLNFTEKGIAAVQDSPSRADAFKAAATKAGVTVDMLVWTLGDYDGVLVISAADEQAAVAAMLDLGKAGNVRTKMLRAFEADEFSAILGRMK